MLALGLRFLREGRGGGVAQLAGAAPEPRDGGSLPGRGGREQSPDPVVVEVAERHGVPGFSESRLLDCACCASWVVSMDRRGYPLEFRRRALNLLEAGCMVVNVERDLDVSEQTLCNWRRRERIDRSLEPGATSLESAALAAANNRIHQLETELTIARRAVELLKEAADPRGVFPSVGGEDTDCRADG